MAKLVSQTYAQALFELAVEENKTSLFLEEASGLLEVIRTNTEFSRFMNEAILEVFIAKVKEYSSIGTAYVTTAIALDEKEKRDIETRLLATTGYKTVECIYDVDSSLIGGMVIKMGDKVVDSSIRTKQEKLQRELLKIQLQN